MEEGMRGREIGVQAREARGGEKSRGREGLSREGA